MRLVPQLVPLHAGELELELLPLPAVVGGCTSCTQFTHSAKAPAFKPLEPEM
jgi:hypothetical protein